MMVGNAAEAYLLIIVTALGPDPDCLLCLRHPGQISTEPALSLCLDLSVLKQDFLPLHQSLDG